MKKSVIIVAGGKGERMNTSIPKQFIEIKGKPVLMHTLEAFYNYDNEICIILVLPVIHIDYWKELCRQYTFPVPHMVAEGGETRFHSVKNGLALVKTPSLVAVHDGVRPQVSKDTISRCYQCAEKYPAVIPVVDSADSIRYVDGDKNHACERKNYKLVQTPQVFDGDLLKKAYEQDFSPAFTDDASVVEAFGTKIYLTEGNRENIKITTAADLKVVECLASPNPSEGGA